MLGRSQGMIPVRRLLVVAAVGALVASVFAASAAAAPTTSSLPGGTPILGGLFDNAGGALVGGALKLFTLNWNAPVTPQQARAFFAWFLTIPWSDIVDHLKSASLLVIAIAYASLALVLTVGVGRFAFTGGGSVAAAGPVNAVARTVLAALAISVWPWIFQQAATLADSLSSALFPMSSAAAAANVMFAWQTAQNIGQTAAGVIPGLSIVIQLIGAFFLLGMVALQVTLILGLGICFVIMPLTFALLPVEGLEGLFMAPARACGVLLLWPSLWAICLLVFAGLGAGVFTHSIASGLNSGSGIVFLISIAVGPIAGLTMIYVCFRLPRQVLQAAVTHSVVGRAMAARGGFPWARIFAAQAVGTGVRAVLGAATGGAGAAASAAGAAKTTAVGKAAARPWAAAATENVRQMAQGNPYSGIKLKADSAKDLATAFSQVDPRFADDLMRQRSAGHDIRPAIAEYVARLEHMGDPVPSAALKTIGAAAGHRGTAIDEGYWSSVQSRIANSAQSDQAIFRQRQAELFARARGQNGFPDPNPGWTDPATVGDRIRRLDPHSRAIVFNAVNQSSAPWGIDRKPLVKAAAESEVVGDRDRMNVFMQLAAMSNSQLRAGVAYAQRPRPKPSKTHP